MRRVASFLGVAFVWALIIGSVTLGYFVVTLPEIRGLGQTAAASSITVLDRNGHVLRQLGGAFGPSVPVDAMPPHVPNAFIAIEDKRFYSHFGVDPVGLARAIVRNVSTGRMAQGGSTLTQQLARNLFLTHERSLTRKIREALLAVWLEYTFTKDEVLTLYLNRVYFGAGAYGVEEASQRYFGKSVRSISVAEAAMLAGLVKAPTTLSPARNLPGAQNRSKIVVTAMADQGYVSQDVAATVKTNPARLSPLRLQSQSDRYFIDWIRGDLGAVTDTLGSGHLVVHTTLDRSLQAAAAQAIRDNLNQDGKRLNVTQAAMVAIGHNGAIRAMVGGYDYARSSFNRAVDAKRQPGSVFKLIPYLVAANAGLTANDQVVDAGVTVEGWTPKNADDTHRGAMTFREAVARSSNTVAVALTEKYGRRNVIELAEQLGLETHDWDPRPALALGVFEVSLLNMTTVYDLIPNGGIHYMPFGIRKVETADGTVLFDHDAELGVPLLSRTAIATMDSLLHAVTVWGTGKEAHMDDVYVGGKTGTTQNGRDAWFIGYAKNDPHAITAGVWVGNDRPSATEASGGGLPARIWRDFMMVAKGNL